MFSTVLWLNFKHFLMMSITNCDYIWELFDYWLATFNIHNRLSFRHKTFIEKHVNNFFSFNLSHARSNKILNYTKKWAVFIEVSQVRTGRPVTNHLTIWNHYHVLYCSHFLLPSILDPRLITSQTEFSLELNLYQCIWDRTFFFKHEVKQLHSGRSAGLVGVGWPFRRRVFKSNSLSKSVQAGHLTTNYGSSPSHPALVPSLEY